MNDSITSCLVGLRSSHVEGSVGTCCIYFCVFAYVRRRENVCVHSICNEKPLRAVIPGLGVLRPASETLSYITRALVRLSS